MSFPKIYENKKNWITFLFSTGYAVYPVKNNHKNNNNNNETFEA